MQFVRIVLCFKRLNSISENENVSKEREGRGNTRQIGEESKHQNKQLSRKGEGSVRPLFGPEI